jgi:prepilin-type processing-associated H-X9-DG protein
MTPVFPNDLSPFVSGTPYNSDSAGNASNIRCRHGNNNNETNSLMADGHVQTFKMGTARATPNGGDLTRGNIYVPFFRSNVLN